MARKKPTPHYPYFLTEALLALAGTVFILYPGTQGYAAIQQAKVGCFYLLFGGYLALMLLFTAEMLLTRQLRLPAPKAVWRGMSIAQKCILLYWLLSFVSALVSDYWPMTVLGLTRDEGLLTITLYCMTFLCVSFFARPKRWLLDAFAAAMTVFSTICLFQLAGFNPLRLYPDGTNYFGTGVDYAGEYLGTVGNADLTAAVLCMAFALFAVAAWKGRGMQRILYAAVSALCLVTLLLSRVRAGILAAVVGVMLLAPLLATTKKGKRLLFACDGALILLALFAVSTVTGGTLYELRCLLRGDVQDDFGSGRIYIWRQVLSLVPQHPWLGTGPDTMAAAAIEWGGTYNEALDGTLNIMIDTAHNEYLGILYHQGIFALLAYLAALADILRRLVRRHDNAACAALGMAVVCYLIQAFFGFSMCASAGLFWLSLGLLENGLSREQQEVRK